MKVLFVWPHKDSFGFKSIGISLLSAIAKRRGWETKLFDTTLFDLGYVDAKNFGESVKLFKPVDLSSYDMSKKKIDLDYEFKSVLTIFKPDCVAMSVLSEEISIAEQLSNTAKEMYCDIPIIWGGKYATLMPEKLLAFNSIDFVCISEGLESFSEFLDAMENKKDLYNIDNIWGKKNGRFIRNSVRQLKDNLDDLPYVDWSIFDRRQFYKVFDGKVYRSGDHMLNWGCPYHCTYCINDFYHRLYDNKYNMRRFSVNRIIKELKFLKKTYSLEFFKFHDEDFLMRPLENLRKLSKAYKEEVGLPFVIETNPKSVVEEKVRILKDMNCVSASIAIESGNPKVRKELLGRVDNEEDICRAFELMKRYGIRSSSFILFAIPRETRQTYEDTIALCRKANVHYVDIGFFFPFEGTKLRNIAIEEGFYDLNDKKRQVFRWDLPALKFKNLSDDDLIAMREVFVLYVKLPVCYELYIRRSETQDQLGTLLRKKIISIYDKTVYENDCWFVDDGNEQRYLEELAAICQDYKSEIKKF